MKINNKMAINPNYKLSKEEKKELGEYYKSDLMGKKMTGNTKFAKTAIKEIIKHKTEIDSQKLAIAKQNKKKEDAIKKDSLQRYPSLTKNKPKGLNLFESSSTNDQNNVPISSKIRKT